MTTQWQQTDIPQHNCFCSLRPLHSCIPSYAMQMPRKENPKHKCHPIVSHHIHTLSGRDLLHVFHKWIPYSSAVNTPGHILYERRNVWLGTDTCMGHLVPTIVLFQNLHHVTACDQRDCTVPGGVHDCVHQTLGPRFTFHRVASPHCPIPYNGLGASDGVGVPHSGFVSNIHLQHTKGDLVPVINGSRRFRSMDGGEGVVNGQLDVHTQDHGFGHNLCHLRGDIFPR